MNILETKMVKILQDLKANHHVAGVKAEFEAECTRLEEAMRLKEVVSRAGLNLTIKVGGCEALKDMHDAKVIGVNKIVGPMIETPYALSKFVHSAKMVFPKEEMGDKVSFFINLETITGYNNLDAMLSSPAIKDIDGVVLGRVDMTGSMGLSREDINDDKIFNIAKDMFTKCHAKGLECVIGGGVSAHSLPFFKNLQSGVLSKYETRKIIFQCPGALDENAPAGILKAVGFELMWLKNKRDFYGNIHKEDAKRIDMLEARYKKLIENAGGATGY
ncbi:MAG: citrate lyase beta subunit [Elusimicrobiota bacterium]|jgi:hypothetical protein|nr:citrate lyase beta subunit [Elusimicrobiota bacterium]